MKYTYLLINFFSFIFPFLLSFERKVHFKQYWKHMLPGWLFTAAVFIIWDHFFTKWGIWSFNPEYILGIYWLGLPLEECLFFLTIPYACVFSYQVFNYYIEEDLLAPAVPVLNVLVPAALFVTAFYYYDKAYTFSACLFAGLFLTFLIYKKAGFLGKFYLMYAGSYIMFLLVNGILTALPVVIYNDMENSGLRIYTIPMEDHAYGFLMLIMNVSFLEFIYEKRFGTLTFRQVRQAR